MLDALSRHRGLTLTATAAPEPLLTDLLDVVVRDRVRQAGPVPDSAAFFDQLDPDQQVEVCAGEDTNVLETIMVRVDVSPTGVFTATVDYDKDHSRTFAPAEVPRYIDTLLMAMTYAEYDAAVFNQLRHVLGRNAAPGAGQRVAQRAMDTVMDLRGSRPPIEQAAVRPLLVRASIGMHTGQPYLSLRLAGTKVAWSWQRASVTHHVELLRTAVVTADMDGAYRRVLVGQYGLDDRTARGVIADLAQWQVEQTGT